MNQVISLDALLASVKGVGEEGVEKVASEQVAAAPTQESPTTQAAKELETVLTKQANEVNPSMSIESTGKSLAEAVMQLVKKAADGTTNQVVAQTSANVASSTAGQVETPREGASVTQTLAGLAQEAIAAGAVRPEALNEALGGGNEAGGGNHHPASTDGNDTHAIDPEEVEKTAALIDLVNRGLDFDTSFALVKAAEEELFAEEVEQVKVACVNAMLGEGTPIEDAVLLVKIAMEADYGQVKQAMVGKGTGLGGVAKGVEAVRDSFTGRKVDAAGIEQTPKIKAQAAVSNAKGWLGQRAQDAAGDFKAVAKLPSGDLRAAAAKGLITNPLVLGGLGAAGVVGGVAAYKHHQKAAALQGLVDAGYSVADALALLDPSAE